MKSDKKITGTVSFQNIGTGFWGIVDADGNKWLPINMPEQLKVDGATVSCRIREAEEAVTVHMWGTPVTITAFETPGP